MNSINSTMTGDDEAANQTIINSSNVTSCVEDVLDGTRAPSTWIEWDDWDQSLWSPEQRLLLEQGVIPREVHISLGILLTLIVLFGVAANSTILYVFSRFKRLRTPANVFIINLTICDFLSCCLHPLSIYSAFRGRWSFGQTGCNLYGMGVAFFGLNSIVTLSAIACERYIVITSSSCRPVVAKWRITRRQAQKACAGIWLHCAALVAPPWLFGWSSYQPEGVLVTCSWDYTSRTLSNRLYYLYLLILGFVLPVSVLTFCYSAIFRFIVRSSREMTRLIMTSDGRASFSKTTMSFRKRRRQTDVRTALIILSLALLCFTAWTPYAIVSLIGQFGPLEDDDDDGQLKLSPLTTSIPAFLAKTAIVFDPLVYGFSHPQFRSSVRQILQQHSIDSSNNGPGRGGVNNNGTTMLVMTRAQHPNYQSPRASSGLVRSSYSRSTIRIKEPSSSSMAHPQFRLSRPDSIGNQQQLGRGGSLRKSCIKRKNSSSFRRKGSRGSKQSQSLAEETSNSSLRLMMLQEESEFYLFRQQQTAAGKKERAVKRERQLQLLSMNRRSSQSQEPNHHTESLWRRSSEPDLFRCSRIISNAPILSWEEYRHKRSQYIRSVFFCSENNLCNRTEYLDKTQPLVSVDFTKDGRLPLPANKSPVSRKSSLTVPPLDIQAFNNRLNLRLHHLDSRSSKSTPSSSGRSSSVASNGRTMTNSRSSYQAQQQPKQIHEDCCECSYRPLSQTVTLVKVPDAGRGGQSQWRACMVSGRDSLSCSLNSP